MRRKTHQTIRKVSDDIGRRYTFNTAIAAVMELLNQLARCPADSAQDRAVMQEGLEAAVLLLAPIVPHICHRLWQDLGHERPVVDEPWPQADPAALASDSCQIVVQVNGKLRARLEVPAGIDAEELQRRALAEENVQRFIAGQAVRKIVVVPGKLVNVVV